MWYQERVTDVVICHEKCLRALLSQVCRLSASSGITGRAGRGERVKQYLDGFMVILNIHARVCDADIAAKVSYALAFSLFSLLVISIVCRRLTPHPLESTARAPYAAQLFTTR